MPTLLITLDAPMQSWGTRSRFDQRDTELEPSKSGVIGLLAAALGRPREADVDDLATLRFGVRVDRAGTLAKDFHTAQNILKADASGRQDTAVTERHYLAEAAFTAGLEGSDRQFLGHLHAALQAPHWPLFLGRRSFPPGLPLVGDVERYVVDSPLMEALTTFPLRPLHGDAPSAARACVLWLEHDAPTGHVRHDQPIDDFRRRGFGLRHVRREVCDVPVEVAA
ncbi:type I-E CRISPR-associated protein Cas5/CasD [Silanimonas sp.]|uniref:type I-E CRISPR-associated protein Cas5/CasD n=1 Tax=Silanimonas sp. TaxID=1929290 RepID=UPI001BC70304|nr:type I-E CRISPR-associated protein Cas5/CasD [Silanimonas sp.]MBS3896247.1 type I-E CRISPR-associated protein Cas5/CasD [Silanimonas sp.]